MKPSSAKTQLHDCTLNFPLWVKSFTTFFLFIILLNSFSAQSQIIAPVSPPTGGFYINGLLEANTNEGDWVVGTGTGGFVLDNSGNPLNAATTFLFRDLFNSRLDNIFATGNQGNADPNTWHWTTSGAPNKNEIHNGLIHITTDATTGDSWAIVAGDRLATTGTAYIDFEFLQNTLVTLPVGTTASNVGDFSSEGPDGGRTVNDLLVTMEYNNGGGVSDLVFYRWREVTPGSGTYDYFEITIAQTTAFAYTNVGTVNVPFGAFNNTFYTANQFVEGAVNLTAIISSISPCLGLSVKTIMVKTKASSAASATLKDFIEPAQVSLNFGFTVTASASPTSLDLAVSNTSQLNATGAPSPNSLYSFSWVQDPASGGSLNFTNIANPIFTATEAGTYTFTVTATQINSPFCTAVTDVTVTVISSSAPCGVSGLSPICPGSTNEYFYDPNEDGVRDSLPANYTSSWSLIDNTNGAQIDWAATTRVSVTAGATCNSTFRVQLTLTSTSGLNIYTCDTLITVEDKTKPTITCPAGSTVQCLGNIPDEPATLAAFLTAGGTASDLCDNSLDYDVDTGPLVGGACGGTVTRTYTVTDNCGNTNTCTQVFTVNDNTKPTITCPSGSTVQCEADVPAGPASLAAFITLGGTASDNCDQSLTYSFTDGPLGDACGGTITRTHRVTDDCGNFETCTQVFTVDDNTPPVITSCPADKYLYSCIDSKLPANTGSATATDNCSGTITPTYQDGSPTTVGCQSIIKRVWTATDACGNTATCEQNIIIIDRTAPVITCPETSSGVANATDDCGTVTVISTISGNNRIWTAIDASGNTSSCTQSLSSSFVSQTASKNSEVVKVNASTEPKSTEVKSLVTNKLKQPLAEKVNGIQLNAFPNPYLNEVSFRFSSSKPGKALLEVFDLVGRRVGIVFQGMLDANIQKTINYKIPVLKSIPMIYKLSIGTENARGKLLPLKN